MARALKPPTIESMQEEVRFLLKTLLRDDLFGEDVSVTEAEKLLESSLSVGFVEYCAFLKRHAFLDIDRIKNTIQVLPRGKSMADGAPDPSLGSLLSAQFSRQLQGQPPPASTSSMQAMPPPTEVLRPRPAVRFDEKREERRESLATVERWVRGTALGQGTLGAVWAARDSILDREVVVKDVKHVFELVTYVPRDELLQRVRAAVMAQARLDHPHILRIVDVGWGETPTIVLDRATESLRTRMARGLMPIPVVLRVLLQAGYALHYAHARGLVHAGLKPENVLFDSAGNVRLADFGIARVSERAVDPGVSAPPVYVGRGNPSYMGPEQLHRGAVSAASDIYALGILLYELLTGVLPGRRSPMPSSVARVLDAVGDKGARALDDLFDKMTRDPLEERYTDIDPVLAAIYSALPKQEVQERGTLLLYEVDPCPPQTSSTGPASHDDLQSAEGAMILATGEFSTPGTRA